MLLIISNSFFYFKYFFYYSTKPDWMKIYDCLIQSCDFSKNLSNSFSYDALRKIYYNKELLTVKTYLCGWMTCPIISVSFNQYLRQPHTKVPHLLSRTGNKLTKFLQNWQRCFSRIFWKRKSNKIGLPLQNYFWRILFVAIID